MNRWLVLGLFFSTSLFAAPKDVLAERLNKYQSVSAEFVQKVISPDGETLLNATGNAKILRPSLFRWETKTPDENLLVSDGETLWYYDPFMSQVTLMSQQQATQQTPFILLTQNKESDWEKYQISQSQDTFTLKDKNGNAGEFKISITPKGVIKGFQVIEQDGQRSEFIFSNVKYHALGRNQFTFKVPDGVEIDDQR